MSDKYKTLLNRFRRGDHMTEAEIEQLHALAAEHGNHLIERLTAPTVVVDDTGFSDGAL